MSIRLGFIVMGIALLAFSFWAHCSKKLTVDYAVTWSLAGACLILIGAVPTFSEWMNSLGKVTEWVLLCIGVPILFMEMHESLAISEMTWKNKELAMQVALLNQENEAIKAEVERLAWTQGEADAEKDLIYH